MILAGRITNPGELRTKVTLQTPTIVKDAGGAQSETWANFATNPNVYAKIVYAHGAEAVSNEALKTNSRMTLTIRYRSDVNGSHAILLGSERWKFIGTPDDIQNRHEYLEIIAELVKGSV
jgi:SPP1 family predicted phage head-tail adaptor